MNNVSTAKALGHEPYPGGRAIGPACRLAAAVSQPARSIGYYSLCVVVMEPDPGYPTTTDDPDYIRDGQELARYDSPTLAKAACDGYSLRPDLLPAHDVAEGNFLVVNDHLGREVHRCPILRAE